MSYALLKVGIASFDLCVNSANLSLDHVTVGIPTIVAALLVAMCAWIDVCFVGAHMASGHDDIRVEVRKLA